MLAVARNWSKVSFYDSINDGAATFWLYRGFPSCNQPPPHHHHQCRRRHYHRYHLCIQKHYPSVIICKHTDTASPSSLYSFPLFSYPSFLPLFLWRRSVSSRVVTDDQGYLLLSFNSRITLANGTSCTSSATSWPAVHVVPASSCQHVHTWQITGTTILLLCRVKHSLCYTETGPTNANSSGTRRQADCLWTRSIAILFHSFFFFFRLDRMKEKCIYLCYRQMKTADVTRMLITFLQDK